MHLFLQLWALLALLILEHVEASPIGAGALGFGSDRHYRIVGGEVAPGPLSYLVSFRFFTKNRWQNYCTGALITPEWVLTAAHCINTQYLKEDKLWIGGADVSDPSQFDILSVTKWRCHPEYDPTLGVQHDICLVKLANPSVKTPLPLLSDLEHETVGTSAAVAGFGVLVDDVTSADSQVLMVANIELLSGKECTKAYGKKYVEKLMICAGIMGGQKDACYGDSGSPLVAHGVQVGIVSWGSGCGSPGLYSVYTRVSAYLKWINDILRSEDAILTSATSNATSVEGEVTPSPPEPEPTTMEDPAADMTDDAYETFTDIGPVPEVSWVYSNPLSGEVDMGGDIPWWDYYATTDGAGALTVATDLGAVEGPSHDGRYAPATEDPVVASALETAAAAPEALGSPSQEPPQPLISHGEGPVNVEPASGPPADPPVDSAAPSAAVATTEAVPYGETATAAPTAPVEATTDGDTAPISIMERPDLVVDLGAEDDKSGDGDEGAHDVSSTQHQSAPSESVVAPDGEGGEAQGEVAINSVEGAEVNAHNETGAGDVHGSNSNRGNRILVDAPDSMAFGGEMTLGEEGPMGDGKGGDISVDGSTDVDKANATQSDDSVVDDKVASGEEEAPVETEAAEKESEVKGEVEGKEEGEGKGKAEGEEEGDVEGEGEGSAETKGEDEGQSVDGPIDVGTGDLGSNNLSAVVVDHGNEDDDGNERSLAGAAVSASGPQQTSSNVAEGLKMFDTGRGDSGVVGQPEKVFINTASLLQSDLPEVQPDVCNQTCVLLMGEVVLRQGPVIYQLRPEELVGERNGSYPLVVPRSGAELLAVYDGPHDTVFRVQKRPGANSTEAETAMRLYSDGMGVTEHSIHLNKGSYAIDVFAPNGTAGSFLVWISTA